MPFFASEYEQQKLYYQVYETEGEPRGIFQLVHGLAEHHMRYLDFIDWLNSLGYVVYAHDHLGHGHNVPEELDLCHIGGPGAWRALVDDTWRMTEIATSEYPDLPLTLFCHSMGSLILRQYLADYGDVLKPTDTVILSGTGLISAPACKAVRPILKFIASFHESWKHNNDFLNSLFSFSMNRGMRPKRDPYAWLSPDPKASKGYQEDPLTKSQYSLGTFLALVDLCIALEDKKNLKKLPKDVPILILAGADDNFGDKAEGPSELHRRYVNYGMETVILEVFPGLRHELVNHEGNEPVLDAIEDFLETYQPL